MKATDPLLLQSLAVKALSVSGATRLLYRPHHIRFDESKIRVTLERRSFNGLLIGDRCQIDQSRLGLFTELQLPLGKKDMPLNLEKFLAEAGGRCRQGWHFWEYAEERFTESLRQDVLNGEYVLAAFVEVQGSLVGMRGCRVSDVFCILAQARVHLSGYPEHFFIQRVYQRAAEVMGPVLLVRHDSLRKVN